MRGAATRSVSSAMLASALWAALVCCGGGPPAAAAPDPLLAVARLTKVHDYPMYVLEYEGDYPLEDRVRTSRVARPDGVAARREPAWACTAFGAFGDAGAPLVGRSFDWSHHAAILLHTAPSRGYASVSMVDPFYLGYGTEDITQLPAGARRALLEAPFLPMDGMNEHGLAVAHLSVPQARPPYVAGRPSVGPLLMTRLVLDRARTVDEALSVMASYNLVLGDPLLHFFVADAGGRAAIVEFVEGEIVVTPNDAPWLAVTNFVVAGTSPEARPGLCPRYRAAAATLGPCGGRLAAPQAMALLAEVAQGHTMWSVVYELTSGRVTVAPGRDFARPVVYSSAW